MSAPEWLIHDDGGRPKLIELVLIGKAGVGVGRRDITRALTAGVGAKGEVCSRDAGRDMAIAQFEIVAGLKQRIEELVAALETARMKGRAAKEPGGCADRCGLHDGLVSKLASPRQHLGSCR